MPTINNSTKKTLSAVFDRSIFNIPKYQRAYSWEESNWRELWDDIKNIVFNSDKEHFVGAVIYYYSDSESSQLTQYEVIDGQQRITTITILMRVIYEKLKENNSPVFTRFADELYEKYIGSLQSESFFLNLSKKDKNFFRDYIQKVNPIRKQGKLVSNKNIRKCYEFFLQKINELIQDNKFEEYKVDQVEELCWAFKKKVETNLIFVTIDVNTDVDAYMIFESINSKRQGLTISDLLKNYIFSAADQFEKNNVDSKKLSITEDNWDRMEQELDKIDVNQYIRHFWISNYKKIFEKELYQNIKLEFGIDYDSTLRFFEKVVSESEVYSSIVNSNIPELSKEGLKALSQLNQLRNKQFYPLILSCLNSGYSDLLSISKFLQQISAVAIRRAIIGKNPNELEVFFADNASKVRKGETSIEKLGDLLSSEEYWISDFDIINEIQTASFEDQEYLAKFILREFELSFDKADEKSINKISLEHVLPRNPENINDWNISPGEHKELLWNIGNLALIAQKYNQRMSNKSFLAKKVSLQQSHIKTTSELAKLEKWEATEIRERNKQISDFIIKCWKKI